MPTSISVKLTSLFIAATAAVSASHVEAASFPCERANTSIEKTICGSSELSNYDEYMGRYYAAAKMWLRHAESCLVNDQRTWIRAVRAACKDAACLRRVYRDRLAVLHSVQPGVTSLRNIELPNVPSLVWIVPPAEDEVAAPRGVQTTPLSVSGQIVNEVATGDGYVLQPSNGHKHIIVPLMFLDQPTTEILAQLAKVTDAEYEVRGQTVSAARKDQSFSASHCTFIYRAPR